MKKWVLKAIVQKGISFLPNGNQVNRWFQKNVTKGIDLTEEYFNNKFGHLVDHVTFYRTFPNQRSFEGIQCLELGTGWYPIIPIGFFLAGAKKTVSVDISPLLTKETFLTCLAETLARKNQFIDALGPAITERLAYLETLYQANHTDSTLHDLCRQINLEVRVADARKLPFGNNNFDLISSNNTFEHIYADILVDILKELWRISKDGGLMSHFIDMSDHFAHMDKRINIYNFLRFSEAAWQRIDNSIQPQNRWRFQQYKDLYEQLGIPAVARKVRPGEPAVVSSMSLAGEFSRFSAEELAISHGYLLSHKS